MNPNLAGFNVRIRESRMGVHWQVRTPVQVELKLREEATLAAYDVIAVCCGTVCARMLMIEGTK